MKHQPTVNGNCTRVKTFTFQKVYKPLTRTPHCGFIQSQISNMDEISFLVCIPTKAYELICGRPYQIFCSMQ